MTKTIFNFLIFCFIFTANASQASETEAFFLKRPSRSVLEEYFSSPATSETPLISIFQGLSSASPFKRYANLSHQEGPVSFGLIVLKDQGDSRDSFDVAKYEQTNRFEKPLEGCAFCSEDIDRVNPNEKGKVIFWGKVDLPKQTGSDKRHDLIGEIGIKKDSRGNNKPEYSLKWTYSW